MNKYIIKDSTIIDSLHKEARVMIKANFLLTRALAHGITLEDPTWKAMMLEYQNGDATSDTWVGLIIDTTRLSRILVEIWHPRRLHFPPHGTSSLKTWQDWLHRNYQEARYYLWDSDPSLPNGEELSMNDFFHRLYRFRHGRVRQSSKD